MIQCRALSPLLRLPLGKNKGSGKCAVNDGKREKALFLSIVAPYDTKKAFAEERILGAS